MITIEDSKLLMTYLFWSSTKIINFFWFLWLIDIKSIINYDYFVLGELVFNQQILPSYLVISSLRSFIDLLLYCPCLQCMLSFIFIIVCGLFEWKWICTDFLSFVYIMYWIRVSVMVFNTTFNNISVILWRSVLLVEETWENHWHAASHWQTLSHIVVSSTPRLNGIRTHNVSSDRHCIELGKEILNSDCQQFN